MEDINKTNEAVTEEVEETIEKPVEEQDTEHMTLAEGIDKIEKNMTKALISTYENGVKNYKMFSVISGLTGAVTATLIAGNLLLENNLEVITNTGTCVAMGAYSIGNALLAKHTEKKKERVEASLNEELTCINALRSKLAILKEKIEYNLINGTMFGIAGAGFTTTFISQLFRSETDILGDGMTIFSSVLTGLVGVGTAVVAKRSISAIKGSKLDIAAVEAEIKAEEEKNVDTAEADKIMRDSINAYHEEKNGRVLK